MRGERWSDSLCREVGGRIGSRKVETTVPVDQLHLDVPRFTQNWVRRAKVLKMQTQGASMRALRGCTLLLRVCMRWASVITAGRHRYAQ